MASGFLQSLLARGSWVSFGILLSRASGFVREVLIGSHFGTSSEAAVLLLVLTLPDLILGLFLGAAIESVFIPRFQMLSGPRRRKLLILVSGVAVGWAICLMILLRIGAGALLHYLVPGFTRATNEMAFEGLRVVSWSLPWIAQSTVMGAFLQSHHRFRLTSLSSAFFNMAVIFGILSVSKPEFQIQWICWFAVGGAMTRCLFLFGEYRAVSRLPDSSHTETSALSLRSTLRDYFFAMGTAASQVTLPTFARSVASLGGESFYALWSYALKLIELPVGILFSAVSTVVFPQLAEEWRVSRQTERRYAHASQVMVVLSVLTLVGLSGFLVVTGHVGGERFFWLKREYPAFVLLALGLIVTLPARALSMLVQSLLQARQAYARVFFVQLASLLFFAVFAVPILLKRASVTVLPYAWIAQSFVLVAGMFIANRNKDRLSLIGKWILFGGYLIWALAYGIELLLL